MQITMICMLDCVLWMCVVTLAAIGNECALEGISLACTKDNAIGLVP